MTAYETEQLSPDCATCGDAELSFDPRDHVTLDHPEWLSLPALLAVVLRPLPIEVCRAILDANDQQLRRVAAAGTGELRVFGVTPKAIEKLRALIEIARRFGQEEFVPGAPFRGSYDVYAHFRERLADEPREIFVAVALDNKNRKLKDIVVSIGSLTSSIVHPREVYLPLIREHAAAVVFVHNHPSSDCTPSREDIEITRRLRDVADLIGIRVLDHVIIGRGKYVSMVDDGFW